MLSAKKCRKEGSNLSYKKELNLFLKETKIKIKKLINDHDAYKKEYNGYLTYQDIIILILFISVITAFSSMVLEAMIVYSLQLKVKSQLIANLPILITIIVDIGILVFIKKTCKIYSNKEIISPEKHFDEQWSNLYKQLIIRKPNLETPTDTQMLNEMAQYDCKPKFYIDTFEYFNEKYPNHSLYATTLFNLWLAENFTTKRQEILNELIKEINLHINDYDYAELISIEDEVIDNVENIKKTDAALIPFNKYIEQLNHHKNLIEKEKNQKALIQNLIKIIDVNIHEINDLKQQTALIATLNTNQDSKSQQHIQPIIQKHQEKARNIYEDTFQLILETLEIVIQNKHDTINVDVNESFRKVLKDYQRQQN